LLVARGTGESARANQVVTIHGRKHGFNSEELVTSYAAIREFLRKYKVLKAE